MVRTLILYKLTDPTKGHSIIEEVAKNMALALGPATHCEITHFNGALENYDFLVLMVPIRDGNLDEEAMAYISRNTDQIKGKKVIFVGSCLVDHTSNMSVQAIESIHYILGQCVILSTAINPEQFTKADFIDLAYTLKSIKDDSAKPMETLLLRKYIDDFILSHNTCVLATAVGDRVRSTPIEYLYVDESLYIISEGGEKFINIIYNPNISISIFDSYTNMNDLHGMQIAGDAEIIETGSVEYQRVFEHKGISYERLVHMPVVLNLIKVVIHKVEFLCTDFSKAGYDIKQILNFYD